VFPQTIRKQKTELRRADEIVPIGKTYVGAVMLISWRKSACLGHAQRANVVVRSSLLICPEERSHFLSFWMAPVANVSDIPGMNPELEAHCSDFLRFPEVPPRFVAGCVRSGLGMVFRSSI
jgi:hypothetical protein